MIKYNVFMPANKRIYNILACNPQTCDGGLITVPSNFEDAYWLKFGTASVTGNEVEAPDCQLGDRLNVGGVGLAAINSIRSQVMNFSGPGLSATVSVQVKRVFTTGELMILNPIDVTLGNYTSGQWRVNVALLSDDWELLTPAHPAVTEDFEFRSFVDNSIQLAFGAEDQTMQIHAWCAHLSET